MYNIQYGEKTRNRLWLISQYMYIPRYIKATYIYSSPDLNNLFYTFNLPFQNAAMYNSDVQSLKF
jgi:hypothetical protein